MFEVETRLRRWGRSFGVVIPMEYIQAARLHENEILDIFVRRKKNPVKETFGKLKLKRTTEEILKESDKECWHD